MAYTKENKFLKAFGKNLKRIREEKKISQSQLAYDCNMEISQISRIERGLINTGIANTYLIANALNISCKELFDFEEKQK